MEKYPAISFMDYEKISDDLCYLGKGVILRFNVVLAKRNQDGTRGYCIKEYKYPVGGKYTDKDKVITVRRSFDYFMSIDVRDDFENSVQIRPKDMINLQSKLRKACEWFNTIFKIKNNELILSGNWKNQRIGNLNGKYIEFEPCIIKYEDQTTKQGVRLYINSDSCFVEIDIDKFMGLVYMISKIDMYQCALSIMSSIPFEYGQNINTIDNGYTNPSLYDNMEGEVKFNKPQRLNNEQRKKTFFD